MPWLSEEAWSKELVANLSTDDLEKTQDIDIPNPKKPKSPTTTQWFLA